MPMTCGAAFNRETAGAVSRLKVARPNPALFGVRGWGGLSFIASSAGGRDKTCAAPRRQAHFIIEGQDV